MLRTRLTYGVFPHSRANNSQVTSSIWPEFEIAREFMDVLVTCKFEDDLIKSQGAILRTTFSPLQVYGFFFFRRSKASNSKVNGPIWCEVEPVRDFMAVLVTYKYDEDLIKMKSPSSGQHFPHYNSVGAFGCRGNQSFDPIYPETLCCLSTTQMMLHIKFEQDWPTGLRDIQVWKYGRRRTDGEQMVYHKLTLWAFGSGEL